MKILGFNLYSWVTYRCTTRARQGKCPFSMKQFGLLHILASLLLFHQFVCPDKKVSLLHYQVV